MSLVINMGFKKVKRFARYKLNIFRKVVCFGCGNIFFYMDGKAFLGIERVIVII